MNIKCVSGELKTREECISCAKCLPSPILETLIPKPYKKKETEKPRFGVTKLTSKCLRQSYYDIIYPTTHSLEKLWVFSRGHAFHNHFQFNENEIFVKKSFPKFDAIGFIDGVHHDAIYELKTTANLPEEPQSHHVLQAQAYYSMLSEEKKANIKKIILVYITLQKIKHFEVPLRDISSILEENGTLLADALKLKVAPNPQKTWLCNYCDHKQKCQEEDEPKQRQSKSDLLEFF